MILTRAIIWAVMERTFQLILNRPNLSDVPAPSPRGRYKWNIPVRTQTAPARCLENSRAQNDVSMVTAISFACYIFGIPHSVFVIVVFPPWKVTWQGKFTWLPRAIMVGRAAMWCGTGQIITRPAVYFHLSSLATTPASSGPRREAWLIDRRPL